MRTFLFAASLIGPACLCGCAREEITATSGAPEMSWDGHTVLPYENLDALHARANDSLRSQEERARAVFAIFAHHVGPGSTNAEVGRAFRDAAWLPQTSVQGVRMLAGWIPIDMGLDERTVFCLGLFPVIAEESKPWSHWVIYFSVSGDLRDEDALAFLRGERHGKDERLIEFALCFPHATNPNGSIGRIERYAQQGIHVYGE